MVFLYPFLVHHSIIVAVIDRKYLEGKKRAAIDPETGERILVPRNMTYEEWYEKYVKGKTKAETAEKKLKNKSADQKQHERYRKVLGDNVPDKLDDFQEMKYNDGEKWKQLQNEAGLLRKTKNSGAFEHLTERMSKKHIRDLAKEYDISLDGMKINIDFNEELLRLPLAGRADSEELGGITFFPNSFKSKEELLRTLFHEKQHVEQFRKFGSEYVQENRVYFEQITEVLEEEFISRLKREGRL